jgi:glycosyltransferase involved in cell wall biosynthesis
MKPRVLLDIASLGLAFERRSAARGVERMVARLFEDLPNAGGCDLSFVATTHLAGTCDFLRAKGVDPDIKLKCRPPQLARSRRAQRLAQKVHEIIQVPGLRARAARKLWSLKAQWLNRGEAEFAAGALAGVDIYHTPHTNYPLLPFPAPIRAHRGLKKFITIHDLMVVTHLEFFKRDHRSYFEKMRWCLGETSFAFCTSESVRADVLALTQLRPERIFLAPLAADCELFHPVSDTSSRAAVIKELGIPAAPYFLALSVNEPHKNFGHLIRCLAELVVSKELTDHNLLIVGRNAASHPLVTGATEKFPQLAGRIVTPGFVPDEKLAALYSGATAFLFPSLAEGFGLPPLEAMQCGVPVISSNTTSMPEVMGDAGILLPPTDVDGWCQAMLRVARDETLREELRSKSLQRAKHFSWEKFITATVHGYRTSLEFTD